MRRVYEEWAEEHVSNAPSRSGGARSEWESGDWDALLSDGGDALVDLLRSEPERSVLLTLRADSACEHSQYYGVLWFLCVKAGDHPVCMFASLGVAHCAHWSLPRAALYGVVCTVRVVPKLHRVRVFRLYRGATCCDV